MADSIRQQILEEIEAVLAAVPSVRRVERKSNPVQTVREFPTIFMLEPTETVSHQPVGFMTFTMSLLLECWVIDDLTQPNLVLNDFLRDVANALLADYTRSDLALDTRLVSNEAFTSQTNRQHGLFLEVVVVYRTSVIDVTEPLPTGF